MKVQILQTETVWYDGTLEDNVLTLGERREVEDSSIVDVIDDENLDTVPDWGIAHVGPPSV